MKAPKLRDDPAWRAMFRRLDARDKAARRAEADRWRSLSHEQKWAEMAGYAHRWRGLARDQRNGLVTRAIDCIDEGGV
jgi:hypothetical protein